MINFSRGGETDLENKLFVALEKWSATNDPSDYAELLRLYELNSGYRQGCGACAAGRRAFSEGLDAFLAGDKAVAFAKIQTSIKSVQFKFDKFKAKFGL
jgi:hypothetical protein